MSDEGGGQGQADPGRQPDPGQLRVSDAERQAVVDRLSKATGEGLITLDEFADHAAAAYAALTRSELDDVTRDLRLPVVVNPYAHLPAPPPMPTAQPAPAAPPVAVPVEVLPKRKWMVAILSGEERKGRWRANRRIGAFAMMGGVDIDLREALLEGPEVEITAWAIMGGVNVVPEGIYVESTGFLLMGGKSNRVKDVEPMPGAPVIRVKCYGMWGGVDIQSKPSRQEIAERRRQQKAERSAAREERRDRQRQRHGGPGFVPPPVPPVPPIPPLGTHRLRHLPPPPPAPAWAWPGQGAPQHEPSVQEPAPPDVPTPDPVAAVAAAGGLVTVVSTDIVGSTRMADTLGDQRWREVLAEHNRVLRDHLGRHAGTEVKLTGDGFLLTFPSARGAVRFGIDVQGALADARAAQPEVPIEVRIGVHAGEVERDGNDVVGRNVNLACRLCDAAAPGEVLVSSVVVALADSSSDIAFGDGRELHLAGIDRAVWAHPARGR
jgi:class 3 adenylate cyclase